MRCFSEDDVQMSKKSRLQGQSPEKSRKVANLVRGQYGGQRTGPASVGGEEFRGVRKDVTLTARVWRCFCRSDFEHDPLRHLMSRGSNPPSFNPWNLRKIFSALGRFCVRLPRNCSTPTCGRKSIHRIWFSRRCYKRSRLNRSIGAIRMRPRPVG